MRDMILTREGDTRCLHRTTTEHFIIPKEKKKKPGTREGLKRSHMACMESVKSYRTQKAEESVYVRFTECLKPPPFSLEQLRTLQHKSIC